MFSSKKFIKLALLAALIMTVSMVSLAQAGPDDARPDRPLPASLDNLRLDAPAAMDAAEMKLDPELAEAMGTQTVLIRLSEASVAEAAADSGMSLTAQWYQSGRITAQQRAFIESALSADSSAKVVSMVDKALNAVIMDIDTAVLGELASSSDVVSMSLVVNYQMDLTETVPYIGGTAVQGMGYDGTGVKVAVLDSGIDYTHANLGGGGTLADYEAAYGTSNADPANTTRDGLFPTAKVVEGYDFVGESWPNGPLAPDEDPIDFDGHGSHVADIIGGMNGVAPGVDLYAVKVCSAVSTSCSGVALINGMDYAMDPNGDGDTSDRVDIINMSLGSNFGTAFDDDLSAAVETATGLGVLTVSSAGNGSDIPYVTGTPSSSPSALAVAQTAVPSAFKPIMEVTAPASIAGLYEAAYQPWSAELTSVIEAPLQFGDGAGGNTLGCDPFPAGSLSGKIVLVDRGACAFSVKISNIAEGDGLIGIIGLVAPGEPFGGAFGGGNPTIPGYMISQADSNALKSGLPNTVVRFDPTSGLQLVGSVVGTSSRGPAMGTNLLKPEIGAPGASVSAEVGTGTGETPFGGTSGASPMVAGSAALLMDAYPTRSWAEIKAVLMNTGETDILNEVTLAGGDLAPISRIGGGEVRVDRALMSPVAAWDADGLTGGLSFGFQEVDRRVTLRKTVVIKNYSDEVGYYEFTPTFRFDNDAASGAVDVRVVPPRIKVQPGEAQTVEVRMVVDAASLHPWVMNAGSGGNDPSALTFNEYDGYLMIDDLYSDAEIHMPWHVLPRRAGHVMTYDTKFDLRYRMRNFGQGDVGVETYSLIAKSDDLPEGGFGEQSPTPDIRYAGYATFFAPAGFCGPNDSFLLQFAVNSWERQTHPVPVSYWFNLDIDQDPTTGGGPYGSEYTILNRDFTLDNVTDGRQLAWVVDWSTGAAGAFFYADHDTNSGNMTLLACGDQLGMDINNIFQPMDVTIEATDFYFGGPGDAIGGITISPFGEQYLGVFDIGGVGYTSLARLDQDYLNIIDYGPFTNNTETGLLVMYRGGHPGSEAMIIEP